MHVPAIIQAIKATPGGGYHPPVLDFCELYPPLGHDDLNVKAELLEILGGQNRARHDEYERFLEVNETTKHISELTERWITHHVVTRIIFKEVLVFMDHLESEVPEVGA